MKKWQVDEAAYLLGVLCGWGFVLNVNDVLRWTCLIGIMVGLAIIVFVKGD